VGTFHAYADKALPHHIGNLLGTRRKLNHLHARIAVSEAAAWTGRRWLGGDYQLIPNGVDVNAVPADPHLPSDELRVLFVGRPEERKGIPVLISAFEALVENVPARLVMIGPTLLDIVPWIRNPLTLHRIEALGWLEHGTCFWRRLHEADVLCAPSLTGESFGMVLIEAFAAGTPVIASNIAGYAEVVSDGVNGVLVPPADSECLAEQLQLMYLNRERRERMSHKARESRPARRQSQRVRRGRIVERDRHHQLMASVGTYHELLGLQSGAYRP
jgi:phosphatidylinositol alpha-mannosyltransferase